MIRYAYDLHPRADPKDGARVIRFTQLQQAEWKAEANGTGSGFEVLPADASDGDSIDPLGLQYVRVVEIDEDTVDGATLSGFAERVVFGFFLENGDFKALDERNSKELTFGGAGTLSYLQRAIMASHAYLDISGFGDMDPFDDTWRLYAAGTGGELGAMLWRVITEAQGFRSGITPYTHRHGDGATYTDIHDDDRLENAIPAVTMTFDQNVDSSGNPWTVTAGEFKAQVGENVLRVVKRLMEAGLYVEMDPDTFELSAWEIANHGRDRSGASWGSSVVRFQTPTDGTLATGNILSDAKRAIAAFIKRSWMLAGGADIYGVATGTADIPWEGFYPSDTEDTAALDGVASVQVGARDDAGDTLRLKGIIGTSPASGQYRPLHADGVLLDDIATVHTGTGQWDFNEDEFPVAAIGGQLRPGGDWDIFYDLGAAYTTMAERAFQAMGVPTHTHPPNPQLCVPAVPGTDTILYDVNFDDGLPVDVAVYPSGVGAWPVADTDASVVDGGGAENGLGYINDAGGVFGVQQKLEALTKLNTREASASSNGNGSGHKRNPRKAQVGTGVSSTSTPAVPV